MKLKLRILVLALGTPIFGLTPFAEGRWAAARADEPAVGETRSVGVGVQYVNQVANTPEGATEARDHLSIGIFADGASAGYHPDFGTERIAVLQAQVSLDISDDSRGLTHDIFFVGKRTDFKRSEGQGCEGGFGMAFRQDLRLHTSQKDFDQLGVRLGLAPGLYCAQGGNGSAAETIIVAAALLELGASGAESRETGEWVGGAEGSVGGYVAFGTELMNANARLTSVLIGPLRGQIELAAGLEISPTESGLGAGLEYRVISLSDALSADRSASDSGPEMTLGFKAFAAF